MSTSFSETGSAGNRSTNSLISADKVHGTDVYNRAGDRLGSVDSIMIDKAGGNVAYVVMSFGGFLGMGEQFHPLPWDVLTYDERLGGYCVDLDREALTNAPSYGREDIDANSYDKAGIDDYYGRSPQRGAGKTENRSDLNDGVERPLGYYSTQAQADRTAGTPGATPTNETADGPGFYSPEQQQARNTNEKGAGRVVGPEGQMASHDYDADRSGAGMDSRTDR